MGKKYKINLNDLESPNSKALSFLHKMKENSRKKSRAYSMIRQQLKKSTEKINKLKLEDPNQTRYVFRQGKSNMRPQG